MLQKAEGTIRGQYAGTYAEAFYKDAAQRHQKQIKERQQRPEAECTAESCFSAVRVQEGRQDAGHECIPNKRCM